VTVAVLALTLIAAATACGERDVRGGSPPSPSGSSDVASALPVNAVVEQVVDGDTLRVRIAGGRHTVRLIGIDTPETVDPRRPVQCYGPEASAHTKSLLPAGTPVHLELDAEPRDVYNRLLVYARRASDGLFVNLDLAANGYADALRIEPNIAYTAEISSAVRDAQSARRGLWGACGGADVPLEPALAGQRGG
jgi:micrococcal nuclease